MILSRPPLSYVPAAPALVGVISAIIVSPLVSGTLLIVFGCIAVGVGLLLAIMRHRWLARFFLLFAFALLSAWWHSDGTSNLEVCQSTVTLDGEITECRPAVSGSRMRVSTVNGYDVELYVRGHRAFCCGDSVMLNTSLSRPSAPRWPMQTDYSAFLERKGIAVTAMAVADSIRVTGRSESIGWKLRRVRDCLADCLRRSSLSDGATSFLLASLLGDTSSVDVDMRQRFSSAGVAHILALSGTHVAVVSLMIAFVLFPMLLVGLRRTMFVVTVVLLWIYAILTGMSPSVVRAVIMATLVAGAYILSRPLSAFNSLFVAAVIILLVDPSSLFSVSFQLSFIAVAGILVVNRLVLLRCGGISKNRGVVFLLTTVIVTFAATIFTAPLIMLYFGAFPVYFLLVNIPATLLIVPVLAGGGLIIMLELLQCSSSIVCRIVDCIYSVLDGIVGVAVSLPGHVISGVGISAFTAVAWMCLIIGLTLILWRPRRWWPRIVAAIAALLLVGGVVCDIRVHGNMPVEEIFMVNDSRYAGLMYRNGRQAWLLTPEPPAIARTLCAKASRVHKKYMSVCGVDSLHIAPSEFNAGHLCRRGAVFTVGDETMMFVNSDTLSIPDEVSMVILCRGTTRKLLHELKSCSADSVVVMPGVHWRVARSVTDSVRGKNVLFHGNTIIYRNFR